MPTVNPRFKIQLLLQWLGPTIAWVHSAKQYYAMVSLSRVVTWYDHFTVNAMLSKQRNLVNPKANDQRQRRFALLDRHVLKLCARHQAHPSHWVRAVISCKRNFCRCARRLTVSNVETGEIDDKVTQCEVLMLKTCGLTFILPRILQQPTITRPVTSLAHLAGRKFSERSPFFKTMSNTFFQGGRKILGASPPCAPMC